MRWLPYPPYERHLLPTILQSTTTAQGFGRPARALPESAAAVIRKAELADRQLRFHDAHDRRLANRRTTSMMAQMSPNES